MGKSSTERVLLPAIRRVLMGSMAVVAVGATVSSCSGDSPYGSSDNGGYIHLFADLNTDVTESSVSGSRAGDEITVDDLTLTITSANGLVNRTYSSLSEFNPEESFTAGTYTFSAFYGTEDAEGFESPYYFGSTDFSVVSGRVTEVSVTATLANTMVTVIPTDAFLAYFSGKCSSTLHSAGGAYVDYPSTETRPAYLRPGTVTLTTSVTLPGGSDATLEVGTFEAKARTHYKVTMDLADSFGDAVILVTFDDLTELEPVEITLSDELANASAPQLTLQGAEAGTPLTSVIGSQLLSDLRFDVSAPGQLRSLTLTTSGNADLLSAGWPAEVDLVSASDFERAAMAALGLRTPGVTTQNTKFASVVLTDVVPALRGQGVTFTLRATDRIGKVSDPVSVEIVLEPLVLGVVSVGELGVKESTMDVTIEYNGTSDSSTFSFLVAEEGTENWVSVKAVKVAAGSTSGTYVVTLEIPADMNSFSLKVCADGFEGDAVEVQREVSPLIVSVPTGSVWATKAYVNLESEVFTAEELAGATFKVETSISARSNGVEVSKCSDGLYLISGLQPATNYSIKVALNGEESDAATFTTETMLDVPNGDFEELESTISANLQQGGLWTIVTWSLSGVTRYTTTVDIQVNEPKGWASTNAKTFYANASNQNSWYMIPSVYNTGLTWSTNQPTAKYAGVGQDAFTETPTEYLDLEAASGSNAMVIRNVAWDADGEAISDDVKVGSLDSSRPNYYCSNEPSISNRSAGKLFLGSYAFDGTNETINQGVDFESRPESMTGVYKYVADVNDPDEAGLATVEILSGNDVIGSGVVELTAAEEYTEFTVPVVYTVLDRKATSLRIMFSSSNHTDESSIVTTNYCNKLECCSRGAALTVDNLKFVY